MAPTLKQMRYLAALDETQHFSRAADQCAVTQSTLSSGIQDLEAALGGALVDRGRRQTVLTPLGREMAARARDVLRSVEEMVAAARSGREPLSGPLQLGVIPTIAPFFLPRILPGLRTRFSNLKLFLREDQTQRLIDLIDQGQLDAAILAFPLEHPAIAAMDLFGDPLLLCRRDTDAPAPRLDTLDPSDLMLLEDGHCLRDHAITSCRLNGRGALNSFQATSLHTLIPMVESGLGSTLVPRMAVDAGILQGTTLKALPFADATPERRIGLAWRRGTSRAEEYELLGEALKSLWPKANSDTLTQSAC